MTLFLRKKNSCREMTREKKYPAHQIARKKILDDQESPTTPLPPRPPQEFNGRHLNRVNSTVLNVK